jgi:WD40 repeat protein
VEYLAAHLSKIHGLDWHPDSEHILATSSQDNSVKVSGTQWDIRGAVGDPQRCDSTLEEKLQCATCSVSFLGAWELNKKLGYIASTSDVAAS